MSGPVTNRQVNKSRVKAEYISSILKETAESVREAQNIVVDEWNLFESGELKKSLRGFFSIGNKDVGGSLSMRYLKYTRFLDIPDRRRKKEGYHLYNRIVFGTLYSYTLPMLRFGFTKDIQEAILQKLARAVGGEENAAELITKEFTKG